MRYSYYNSKVNHALAQQASLILSADNIKTVDVAKKEMTKENLIISAKKIGQGNTSYLKECEEYGVSRDVLVKALRKYGLYSGIVEKLRKQKQNRKAAKNG